MKRDCGALRKKHPEEKECSDYILAKRAKAGAWVEVSGYSVWIRKEEIHIYIKGRETEPARAVFDLRSGKKQEAVFARMYGVLLDVANRWDKEDHKDAPALGKRIYRVLDDADRF